MLQIRVPDYSDRYSHKLTAGDSVQNHTVRPVDRLKSRVFTQTVCIVECHIGPAVRMKIQIFSHICVIRVIIACRQIRRQHQNAHMFHRDVCVRRFIIKYAVICIVTPLLNIHLRSVISAIRVEAVPAPQGHAVIVACHLIDVIAFAVQLVPCDLLIKIALHISVRFVEIYGINIFRFNDSIAEIRVIPPIIFRFCTIFHVHTVIQCPDGILICSTLITLCKELFARHLIHARLIHKQHAGSPCEKYHRTERDADPRCRFCSHTVFSVSHTVSSIL